MQAGLWGAALKAAGRLVAARAGVVRAGHGVGPRGGAKLPRPALSLLTPEEWTLRH